MKYFTAMILFLRSVDKSIMLRTRKFADRFPDNFWILLAALEGSLVTMSLCLLSLIVTFEIAAFADEFHIGLVTRILMFPAMILSAFLFLVAFHTVQSTGYNFGKAP